MNTLKSCIDACLACLVACEKCAGFCEEMTSVKAS